MTDAEENDVDLLFQLPDSFSPCFFIAAKISFDSTWNFSKSTSPGNEWKKWTCIRVKRQEMTKIEIKIDRIPENKNIN